LEEKNAATAGPAAAAHKRSSSIRPSILESPCAKEGTGQGGHALLGLGVGQPEIATAALEPGDRVLFYTDGVVEGRSLAGEPFGEARLADLVVRETLAGQPAAETMRQLAHAILAHQGTSPRDDATGEHLLVALQGPGPLVRRAGPAGWPSASVSMIRAASVSGRSPLTARLVPGCRERVDPAGSEFHELGPQAGQGAAL
jgi:hypothetical protein